MPNQMSNLMIIFRNNLLFEWCVYMCVWELLGCSTATLISISKTIRWLFRLFFIYIIFLLSRSLPNPCSFHFQKDLFIVVERFFLFRFGILLSMCSNYGHFHFRRNQYIGRRMRDRCDVKNVGPKYKKNADNKLSNNYFLMALI